MIRVNIPNFITVGLIAVISTVALKYGLQAAGYKPDWL